MPDEAQEAQAELARAAARAQELAAEQASLELDRVGGQFDAERTRAEMEAVAKRMERAERDVQRATDRVKRELDRQVKAMELDLRERMDAVNAALEPVRRRLKLMEEGIETLSLYLSAAQGVVTIRDGQRADALEPIFIRQMVLAMDEETGLFAEEGGITADDVGAFDRWLLASPENVAQVVPEEKAVVALVARWNERRYRDPWSHDPKDKVTHFLIRNGEALFRTTVNDFHAGRVLIPTADEFVGFFRRRRYSFEERRDAYEALKPGTREYAEAMEQVDARSRHFLRIGLILQGLVDNSEVFEPLHPAGINMLTDPSERSEKVRVIADAEGGLGSGEATFSEWQREVNARLRPGMRVIGAFDGEPFYASNEWPGESYRSYGPQGHSRVYPTGWNYPKPPSGVPLRIEWRKDGGLVCPFERGTVYDPELWVPDPERPGWGWRGGDRPAKRRASVTVYPHDEFVLAYDLIESSEQLKRFLADRRNREEYREVWPLIRSAMFAKRAEEEAEAPFRQMLAGVLARENGVSVEDAEREVPDLVRWFKLKNRWARSLTLQTMRRMGEDGEEEEDEEDLTALLNERTAKGRLTSRALEARRRVGEETYDAERYRESLREKPARPRGDEHEAKAVRMIVAEHARRVADRRRPVDPGRVMELRNKHPEAVLVARPRKGGYLVLLPADPVESVWVHELEYPAARWGPDGQGAPRERRDWRLVSSDRVSRWTIAHEHPRWGDWVQNASERDHLRGPEFERLLGQLQRVGDDERLMMVSYSAPTTERRGRFTAWVMTGEGTVETGPKYKARDYVWQREAGGVVALKRPREFSYWHDDEHEWSEGDAVEAPWEGHYASQHVGRVLWGPDAEVLALWKRLRETHLTHKRAEQALDNQASELAETVVDQWRALEENRLREEFLAEVPDATWDEWQEYLEEHRPRRYGYRGRDALADGIRRLLVAGTDPLGLTVQEALGNAGEGAEDGDPEKLLAAWASLVIGDAPVPTPTDPSLEDEDEDEPDDGIEVLDPEEEEPEEDVFDDLRRAFRG